MPEDFPTVQAAVDAVAADRIPWVRPEPFWVRHPHVAGMLTFAVFVVLGLLLAGCECGIGWPCER